MTYFVDDYPIFDGWTPIFCAFWPILSMIIQFLVIFDQFMTYFGDFYPIFDDYYPIFGAFWSILLMIILFFVIFDHFSSME